MTKTRIEVDYPASRGLVALRGADPDLGLEVEASPTRASGNRQLFELDLPDGSLVEFKLRRDDGEWAAGRDLHMLAFAGMEHGNAAWSERLAIPLQLMFPPAAGGPNAASGRSARSA